MVTRPHFQGIGSPSKVCGMTYLDEIMNKKRIGPAIAVANLVGLLGFSISFILGGYLLTQYVTLGAPPAGVAEGSSQWVGAWWMGFVAPGILLAITGLPIGLFPDQMPAAKVCYSIAGFSV